MNSRPGPRTFDQTQSVRRHSSNILFCFLILFYFMAFAFIWIIARTVFSLWTGSLFVWKSFSVSEFLAIFGIAFSVALLHWLDALFNGVRRIISSLGARKPDPRDRYHRTLMDIVDEMKLASGITELRVMVMPVVAMNAFSVADSRGRSIIGITEGLLSRMNRRQLQAVVAHETAHLREKDHVLVTMSCSLFGVFSQMLAGLRSAMEEDGRAGVFYPVLWFITLGAYFLNVLVSRQREYLADATAVELTRDPVALAEALYKLKSHWRGEGMTRAELAPIFIVNPDSLSLDDSAGIISDFFSTHPPIKERIRVLLRMAHVGMSQLLKAVENEEKSREAGEPEPVSDKRGTALWIAHHEGNWHGPYTSAELKAQGWLSSQTWVNLAGSKEILPAKEIKIFMDYFIGKGDGPAAGKMCPVCGIPLKEKEYEGIAVLRCSACRGVLLEKDQEYRVLSREEKIFSSRIKQKADIFLNKNPLRPRKGKSKPEEHLPKLYNCPKCGKRMWRQFYSYQYFVEVDRCLGCRLTWFDGDELEILQVLVEKARK